MNKSYRLPDGRHTSSQKTYLSAWRKLYRPIEKEFGWECHGYNPNLYFVDKDRNTQSITVVLATKLCELIGIKNLFAIKSGNAWSNSKLKDLK
jgi:hypothetical protein